MSGLEKAGCTEDAHFVDEFHQKLEGGDDLWRTDGRLGAVVLKPERVGTK